MTRILFDPRTDTSVGTRALGATVTARATQARADGAIVVYPSTLGWRFTSDQRPEMDLPAPAVDWAWILEVVPDQGRTKRRVVRFADGPPVAYADLVDVDPATLTPGDPGALEAWQAVLAEVQAARDAVLEATAPVLDAPDLTLIFENGLA